MVPTKSPLMTWALTWPLIANPNINTAMPKKTQSAEMTQWVQSAFQRSR
jgi:hypothetical protein